MYKKEIAKNCKIWKMDKDMNPKKYHSIIKAAAAPQMRESYKLKNSHGNFNIIKVNFLIKKTV